MQILSVNREVRNASSKLGRNDLPFIYGGGNLLEFNLYYSLTIDIYKIKYFFNYHQDIYHVIETYNPTPMNDNTV